MNNIHFAAETNQIQCLELLLHSRPRDTELKDEALMIACRLGYTNMVEKLLELGASGEFWDSTVDRTPLSESAFHGHLAILRTLLKWGNDANVRSGGNRATPLHLCAMEGHADCVTLLLSYEADPDVRDCYDHTPIKYATLRGSSECVDALLEAGKGVRYITASDMKDILTIAVEHEHSNCIKVLLEHQPLLACEDYKGFPLLVHASKIGCYEIVKAIVETGADVNIVGDPPISALHFAAEKGHCRIVELLASKGAMLDPTLQKLGSTPLMLACHSGHSDVLHFLVKAGSNINGRDRRRRTAIHYALLGNKMHCLRELLSVGANPNLHNEDSKQAAYFPLDIPPLHIALQKNNLEAVKLLIQASCDVNLIAYHYHETSFLTRNKYTPFAYCIEKGHLKALQMLAVGGCDLSIVKEWKSEDNVPDKLKEHMPVIEYLRGIWKNQCGLQRLKEHCRKSIRSHFGLYIMTCLHSFEIPITLRNYLIFDEELDEIKNKTGYS